MMRTGSGAALVKREPSTPCANDDSASCRNQMDAFFRSIPPEGSLGLLALGAVGVVAWRKKRDAVAAAALESKSEQEFHKESDG